MSGHQKWSGIRHKFTPEQLAARTAEVAQALQLKPVYLDRVLMWLLKYDFIRRA